MQAKHLVKSEAIASLERQVDFALCLCHTVVSHTATHPVWLAIIEICSENEPVDARDGGG